MKISIIIPAYNEEETVGELLEKILNVDLTGLHLEKEIIVVDDGSTDETARRVSPFANIRLIRHKWNQGKTAAIRTGLAFATGEIILIQDADLEYDPQDYPRLVHPIVTKGAEVVYGSRFMERGIPMKMSLLSFIANRLGTVLTNLLYGSHLTDEATCYKVFTRQAISDVTFQSGGFGFCPEVTTKLLKKGIAIYEVPIHYTARKRGKKFRPLDALTILRILLGNRLRFFG
ncbi:MAG: glycosyltransferase family 2 protein [Candidatus Omnitrophica bacterium]|nr:glycosyltransferase family 2 protein [Candidatus Omnitrophota bacterium]